MKPKLKLLLLILVVFVITSNAVFACPTCTEGMANDPHQASMIRGYFWSILFMMSMPFLIFFGLSSYFYYLVCKSKSEQAALAAGGGEMNALADGCVEAMASAGIPAEV